MTSRRALLKTVTSVVAASALSACPRRRSEVAVPPLPQPADSLKAHAAARGFLFGCAVDITLVQQDPAYARLIRDQAAIIAGDDAMQWPVLRPQPTAFHFDEADAVVAFAESAAIKVRGHALCDHHVPSWFLATATRGNARELLRTHIETVAGRYGGRMHSWDVVGDPVLVGDGRPDGLRNSPWLSLVGEDYLEQAFRIARLADPQALLTLSEYGLHGEDQAAYRKRAALLILLRRLHTRHVPVDAVAIEMHLLAGEPASGSGFRGFLAQLRDLGLQVFLTQLTVDDSLLASDPHARDASVAALYASFLDTALVDPAVTAVLTAGITDRYPGRPAEDHRSLQRPARGLPFGLLDGVDDTPKPAFFAMRNSFDTRRRI